MAIETKTVESPAELERRRSPRLRVVLPVEMRWLTGEGPHAEGVETEVVNAHGALLRLKTRLNIPPELELRNPQTGQSTPAHAVWKDTKPDGTVTLAVALEAPGEAFWGVDLEPRQ